jgi:hypothetical protein
VQYVQHVTAMQRIARGAIIRRRYKDNRQGAIRVQAVMRGAIERKRYKYVDTTVTFTTVTLLTHYSTVNGDVAVSIGNTVT